MLLKQSINDPFKEESFMAIFYRDSRIFNELQVNGQEVGDSDDNAVNNTDYTQDSDNAEANDNPADAPEDYTVPDQGEDQTPEEADNNTPDQGTEADPNDQGDAGTDYTQDNPDAGGDPNAGGDPGAGGDPNAEGGDPNVEAEGDVGGEEYSDDSADKSDDEIKQMEDELFSNFNDAQIAIMTTNLKTKFVELYDMLDAVIEKINDTPKEDHMIRAIAYISNKLAEVRDMLSDYLDTTFYTKSFIENKINYKRFCITINQINSMIAEIYPDKGK